MADNTSDPTVAPAPPAAYKPQSTPGPVARGLSTALMQGAFEKFGHAFTDTGDVRRDTMSEDSRMAPWREQGQKVAGALEMRWHTMEYENFQAAEVEPYIQAKKGMLQEYQQRHEMLNQGQWIGADGQIQQFDISKPQDREQLIRIRGQLENNYYGQSGEQDIELFHKAYKYGNNPLISNRIQAIATTYSEMLMTVANPQDTLQSENILSEIDARGRNVAVNERLAATQAQQTRELKRPKDLREAAAHPEIGPGGIMQWLMFTPEGSEIMFGSAGADAYRNAKESMRQQLLKDYPDLSKDPEAVESRLLGLEGRIKNIAAAEMLKRMSPELYQQAKQMTPHFFDYTKGGAQDGILGPDDERGIKGEKRLSTDRKKDLYNSWKTQWDAELDKWASDASNPPDADAAMQHMERWLSEAIINGAPGIPSGITIVPNEETRELRAELQAALIERGGRTVYKQKHIGAAHPVRSLFSSGSDKRPGGRRGAAARARERRRREGLLGED